MIEWQGYLINPKNIAYVTTVQVDDDDHWAVKISFIGDTHILVHGTKAQVESEFIKFRQRLVPTNL